MNYDSICLKIYEHSCTKFDYETLLLENGIDSVSIIEIIMNIEEKFNIEFEPSMLNYNLFKSINTISEYVYKHLSKDQRNEKS